MVIHSIEHLPHSSGECVSRPSDEITVKDVPFGQRSWITTPIVELNIGGASDYVMAANMAASLNLILFWATSPLSDAYDW
jgi:hypothetical protein